MDIQKLLSILSEVEDSVPERQMTKDEEKALVKAAKDLVDGKYNEGKGKSGRKQEFLDRLDGLLNE